MGRKKVEINPESGNRLRAWLKEVNVSAQALCTSIGYTPQYMSDIITGKKRLTPDLAQLIENAPLGIPPEKKVRREYLLCKDNYMTELHWTEDYEAKSSKFNSDLVSVIKGLGYSVDQLDTTGNNIKDYNLIMDSCGRPHADSVVKIANAAGVECIIPYKDWIYFKEELTKYIRFKMGELYSNDTIYSEHIVQKVRL